MVASPHSSAWTGSLLHHCIVPQAIAQCHIASHIKYRSNNMISYALDSPPSPGGDIRVFFKRTKARRALTELGPNDTKANLRMAEALLTISQQHFIDKYNFDPVRMQPLPGAYEWKAVKARGAALRQGEEEQDIPYSLDACYAPVRPTPRLAHHPDMPCALPTAPALPTTPKKSPKKSKTQATTPKPKQCKITDYGRQRKRVHSTCKCEEGEPEVVTPRKKPARPPTSPTPSE